MAETPYWYKLDRQPSITETVTIDGSPVDLTTSTARKFRMRAIGSSTLKVDANATVVTPPGVDGKLRYDWGATDLDTAGTYLVWWDITISGKVQAVGEALIQVRPHAPASGSYLEIEVFKQLIGIEATSRHDVRATKSVEAACRTIDAFRNTQFYPTEDAERLFTADRVADELCIGDWAAIDMVEVDTTNDGVHDTTWDANIDFVAGPANAAADGVPYTRLQIPSWSAVRFPAATNGVKVTGTYGWAAAPAVVAQAAEILATRLFKRAETPYGIVTVGSDMIAAARLGRIDPDVATLLDNILGQQKPGLRSARLG